MIQLTCVDDTQRPAEIPPEKWVKNGSVYTPTFAIFVVPQRVLAVELLELELTAKEAPYDYFKASRFTLPVGDWEEWLAFIDDCLKQYKSIHKLTETEVNKIAKQVELIDN